MAIFHAFESCDGMIFSSAEPYDCHGITAVKEWFSRTNRDAWALGPLLPPTASKEAIAGEEVLSATSASVRKFMDEVLTVHGSHSMLFVCFYTLFKLIHLTPSLIDFLRIHLLADTTRESRSLHRRGHREKHSLCEMQISNRGREILNASTTDFGMWLTSRGADRCPQGED